MAKQDDDLSLDCKVINDQLKQTFDIEVTKNYEGDLYHCAVFVSDFGTNDNEHYETKGFDTERDLFEYLQYLFTLSY
tara:strand:+ start:73 stop:303 length:231 start_codon:yes stop_codon:yes gene_type:complete